MEINVICIVILDILEWSVNQFVFIKLKNDLKK